LKNEIIVIFLWTFITSTAIIKEGEVIHSLERHQIKGYPVEDITEEVRKGIALADA
jgi:hypothetical protein